MMDFLTDPSSSRRTSQEGGAPPPPIGGTGMGVDGSALQLKLTLFPISVVLLQLKIVFKTLYMC